MKRRILLISHVLPGLPTAGNELRINRLLHVIKQRGFIVDFIFVPMSSAEIIEPKVELSRTLVDSFYLVEKWKLKDVPLPAEIKLSEADFSERVRSIQDMFICPKVFDQVKKIIQEKHFHVVVSEYIFFSRVFLLFPGNRVQKVIDTHDLFSTKMKKVLRYGIKDVLAITENEEKCLLSRANLIVAIQANERKLIQSWNLEAKVLQVGVNLSHAIEKPVVKSNEHLGSNKKKKILFVSSNNQLNRKGLEGFYRWVWKNSNLRDSFEFWIVGSILPSEEVKNADGVRYWGPQVRLDPFYKEAFMAINPVKAGTGLKVKTVEALFHGVPVLSFPNGIDGIKTLVRSSCRPFVEVNSWKGFVREIEEMGRAPEKVKMLKENIEAFSKSMNFDQEEKTLVEELAK